MRLRSLGTWAILLPLTGALVLVVSLGAVLTLGRGRDRLVAWALPRWAALFQAVSGIHLDIHGAERVATRRPRVLVVNHGSILDMVVVAALNPPAPCPVVKREMAWTPPLNLVFLVMGAAFVARGDHTRAVASMARAAHKVRDGARTAPIAPEGTRTRDGRLQPFKSGAFHLAAQAGAEIVPVVIHGAWDLFPPTGITMRPGTVRVEVMPPEPPPTDPRAAAQDLHDRYVTWLGAR